MSAFINVRTKNYHDPEIPIIIESKLIWKGLVNHIPRKGDFVIVSPGSHDELVHDVISDLTKGHVDIWIGQDPDGEYPEVKEGPA